MKARDICVILCAFAYVFIGASLSILEEQAEEQSILIVEEPAQEEPHEIEHWNLVYVQNSHFRCILDTTPVTYTTEIDTEEYTCLMYATVPIGRYYITAYNHEETGSKRTASGAICHEGTITTCASDTRYLPFGTFIEVGGRLYKCEDTGSLVKKKHVDLYFKSYKEMARYNSHYEEIYRVEFPFGVPKYE